MKNILLGLLIVTSASLAIELGQIPPKVVISGKDGSCVNGTPWISTMLKDRVHVLFYVDPDEKDLNTLLTERIKAKKFNAKVFHSVGIVNLAATWMPNALLESRLQEKQEKFPRTLYVKDKKKVLVKEWGLADDDYNVLIFDKQGKLIYKYSGEVPEEEIAQVIQLIEKNL